MVVCNPELANSSTMLSGGFHAFFDEKGEAEVPETWEGIGPDGRSRVKGFTLVSGQPKVQFLDEGKIVHGDGPQVICLCPGDMAGQQTMCPDGRTVAYFNAQRLAFVPNTCRLDEIPGFRYLDTTDLNEAVKEAVELTANDPPPLKQQAHGALPQTLPLEHIRKPITPAEIEAKRNEARAKAMIQPPPDPRVRRGTQELPLTAVRLPSAPTIFSEEVPLVPLTEAEQAVARQAQEVAVESGVEPNEEQAAMLEGAAPKASQFQCPKCPRDDFRTRQAFAAHKHSCKGVPPVTVTPPMPVEPAATTPEADARKAAMEAAMSEIDN